MTYSSILNNQDYFSEGLLVRISPRRKVLHSAFSLYSGSVYSAEFDFGPVRGVEIDGVSLTEGTSTTLAAGEWFFQNETLYIRMSDSGAPDSGDFIVVTYDLFVSDRDYEWYRDPLDDTSELVAWSPYIRKFPQVKQTTSDILTGFIPTTVDSIDLDNSEHWLERHLDGSFYKAEVVGWHFVDSMTVANTSNILNGLIEGIDYSQAQVTFALTDIYEEFNKEFRTGDTSSDFYAQSEFAGLDNNFIGRPKRTVFGYVRGLKCVNLDFSESNAESDNQLWGVMDNAKGVVYGQGYIDLDGKVLQVPASPTITFVNADYADNFEIGDQLFCVTGFIHMGERYVVSKGAGTITLNANAPANIGVAGQYVFRGQVPRIRIEQNNTVYTARWLKHYTISQSNDVVYATFLAGYSAGLGMSPIKNSDQVFADVYGINDYGSSYFDTDNDPIYDSIVNPVAVLAYLLIESLGIPETELSANWDTLKGTITEKIGFAIPKDVTGDYPTFKDLISEICLTSRLRIFKNNENKWDIKRIDAITSTVDTASDDDIISDSFSATFEFSDVISDVFVEYNRRERGLLAGKNATEYDIVSAQSETASYLHKVTKQRTFQSLHMLETDAQDLCNFLRNYFGQRKGTYKARLQKRFLDSLIADEVTISREKLPGSVYQEGVLNTKDLVVTEINKSPNSINLTFDDQQGIEENA